MYLTAHLGGGVEAVKSINKINDKSIQRPNYLGMVCPRISGSEVETMGYIKYRLRLSQKLVAHY